MLKVSNLFALAAALVAAACADPTHADGSHLMMWKSLGSRQCQGGGTTAQALADALRSAGVEVVSVACGRDGNIRPMLCGLPDDRIAVVELSDTQRALATAQGFAPIDKLPHWQPQACPSDQ
jgi:uncharacterized metal-binding protein